MKRYFSSRKAQGCSKLLSKSVHGNENFMERKKKKNIWKMLDCLSVVGCKRGFPKSCDGRSIE